MQFLQEVLTGVRRLDDSDDDGDLDLDVDPTDDDQEDDRGDQDGSSDSDSDSEFDLDGQNFDEHPDSGKGFTGTPDDGAPFDAPTSSKSNSQSSGDQLDLDVDPTDDQDHPELDGIESDVEQNPNKQGLIRTVKGAHLVYKRNTEDGSFEELWIYNMDSLRDELKIKKAILAGTDIPINKTTSPDGSQSYDIWSSGNAEMILIHGLPN